MNNSLIIRGAPGSPYTRKMLAVLRYRHIPYCFALPGSKLTDGLAKAKVELMPTFWFPGENEAVVDSTPIIRDLEERYDGRSVIPEDSVLAFLDYLIEDYADEWLTKAMFHYRWWYAADIEQAGLVLPRWRDLNCTDEELQPRSQFIRDRQIGRLYVVGSNATTAPVIEESYRRFLQVFGEHMNRASFCFGDRPAASDFGLYGQLTQLAMFDPTPMAETFKVSPRVHAWTGIVDDLSGLEPGEWMGRDAAITALRPLLEEIGRVYPPVLLANAAAIDSGVDTFETTIAGLPWKQQTFPYQAKCLQWLRQAYVRLEQGDRGVIDTALAGTGIDVLFQRPQR